MKIIPVMKIIGLENFSRLGMDIFKIFEISLECFILCKPETNKNIHSVPSLCSLHSVSAVLVRHYDFTP